MKNGTMDREINLVDMFWAVCLKWRMMVLWAVIFAILAGGVSYLKSVQAAKAVTEAPEEVKLEKIELEEDEQDRIDFLSEYERLYENQMLYNQNAPLMQLEPSGFYVGTVSYYVDNHFTLEYPVLGKINNINSIVQTYKTQFDNVEFSKKLSETIGLEDEKAVYALELVDLEGKYGNNTNSSANVIVISIYAADEQTCKGIIQLVKETVDAEKLTATEKFGEHEIILLEDDCRYTSNNQLLEYQQKNVDKLSVYNKTIADMKSKLSEEGLVYIESLENDLDTKQSDTIEDVKEEVAVVGVSITYVIIGLLSGAVVVAFFVALLYLFNYRIRLEDEFEAIFDINLLGNIVKDENKKKKWFAFVDNFFIKMRHANKRYFAETDAVSMVSAGIKIASKKLCVDRVYVTGTNVGTEEKTVIEKLRKELEKSRIELVAGKPILYDAEALETSVEISCVILVERAGEALYREIFDEIEICKHQGVKILGAVVIA